MVASSWSRCANPRHDSSPGCAFCDHQMPARAPALKGGTSRLIVHCLQVPLGHWHHMRPAGAPAGPFQSSNVVVRGTPMPRPPPPPPKCLVGGGFWRGGGGGGGGEGGPQGGGAGGAQIRGGAR